MQHSGHRSQIIPFECFKRGLKPEVEQRLENADDMEHIVQNAIKAERLVEARRVLRKEGSDQVGN